MLTDNKSTWQEHRDALLRMCHAWGVTFRELADATTRMAELSNKEREDLMSRADQILR
jgi:hypothetical protein